MNNIKNKNRESGFEALRLICMLYIILHHFIVFGLKNAGFCITPFNAISTIGNSLFIIAVNCFILISGYFKISPSWKGFWHLYIMIASYTLIINIIFFISYDYFSIREIISSFLPFSHSPYWFISNYFYLFLVAPLLNKIIENSTRKQHLYALLILSILAVYFGFLSGGEINIRGYNLMNFIFLYFIGRFIALYTTRSYSKKARAYYYIGYIIISLIIAVCAAFVHIFELNCSNMLKVYAYNNPLVIISAILFFLFFRTFSFQSKTINYIARSSLAIYLIHENPHIRTLLYQYINELSHHFNLGLVIILPLLAVILAIICIIIDILRRAITDPIEKYINSFNINSLLKNRINKIPFLRKFCNAERLD